MLHNEPIESFAQGSVSKVVLKNVLPAMAAQLMILVYNLADTFFIAQTHNDYMVAAVSLATPVFLIFMSLGTLFGIGGTSVIPVRLAQVKMIMPERSALSVCGAVSSSAVC